MKKRLFILFTLVMVLSLCLAVFSSAVTTTLTLDKASYTVGDSVKITFANGSTDPNAWIAISPAGVTYELPGNNNKVWCYVNSGTEQAGTSALTEGSVTLNTITSKISLPAGDYKVTYFPDISYTVGTEKTLTISAANPGTRDALNTLARVAIVSMAAVVIMKRKSVFG